MFPVAASARALAAFLVLSLPLAASEADRSAGCPADDFVPIREIRLEGLRSTREKVVARELGHRAGGAFSCSTWARERLRLEDLDIFADVRVRADSGRLIYSFQELPPYIPFVSVLLTEQDGFSMGPALASLNFLGLGIRAEFMARFGGTTEFQASLSSTWLGGWPVEYDVAAIWVDSYNPFEDFHEDSRRLKADFRQRLGGAANLLYHGELFLLRNGRADSGAAQVTLTPGWDFIPRLGLGAMWDGRDRRHNPRRGVFQEWRATQNGGWLGGDADYVEWLSDTRLYLPWLERNVLYLGALYQYRTGEAGLTFPIYDRFHAGGMNTLRGFGNDALQGRSEWIATLENRVDLYRKRIFRLWKWSGYFGLQGVAGVEAASLWGHDAPMEGDFQAGGFLGIHLILAGVDRLRLEVGSNTAKMEFHHGFGILEKADAQRFRSR